MISPGSVFTIKDSCNQEVLSGVTNTAGDAIFYFILLNVQLLDAVVTVSEIGFFSLEPEGG